VQPVVGVWSAQTTISAEVVKAARGTIKTMTLHNRMPHGFTQIEIDFGIKLDAEVSLNVTLTWERPSKAAKGK
jgi:hypothetical protein